MCFEETCLPLCNQWFHMNDPYCQENGLGIYAGRPQPQTTKTTPAPFCEVGDRFVESAGDDGSSFIRRLLNSVGVVYKTGMERAHECKDYLKETTGRDFFVSVGSEPIDDSPRRYFQVLDGKK